MFNRTDDEIDFLYKHQSHPFVIEYIEMLAYCLDKGIIDLVSINTAWQKVVDLMIKEHVRTDLPLQ